MTERTVKCHICGKPYVVYAFYAGDQSECRACQAEACRGVERDSTEIERLRRRQAFGNP